MTSTANPQDPTQAPNTAAPSYASAASAPKKPGTTSPNSVVASGSHPPSVVVGSSASGPPSGQAKPASVSPANGRPSIPPALPVVHGSSSANGGVGDHARKPSVTISANGPPSYGANGGPVGNSKSSIQFGFKDSPGVSHSTPQPGAASPIPIPGSGQARVASPAQSPSPIPQPTASGGRPPSGLQQSDGKPSFGSFNNDPERHMRQSLPPNNFQNQSFHNRQGSNISMASTGDMGNQGMPGPNRGGFHHGGRGRGFNPNNPPYNPHNPATGYPPQSSFRNGHSQARNSIPSFQPQPPPRGYANSPQPNRGSPALVPSNPNTPSMPPAMPAPNTPQFYQPSMAAQPVVTPPSLSFSSPSLESQSFYLRNTRRNGLYDSNKRTFESHGGGRGNQQQRPYTQSLRLSKRGGKQSWMAGHDSYNVGPPRDMRLNMRRVSDEASNHPTPAPPTLEECRQQLIDVDLSPECHNFEIIQKMLTDRKQNMTGYGYPPPGGMNPYPGPMGHNPYAGYPMHYPNQSGSPAYGPGYGAPPYQPTGPTTMARTPSASEKPNYGSVPPSQPVVATTPQMSQAQPKPPVASGSGNSLPRPAPAKKAIVIKRPDGGIVDVGNIKPSSPAPSRTPPATASAATPPTKPSTPAQTRPESTAPPKTREEIQEELRTKIAQATAQTGPSADVSKDDEASKAEGDKAKQEAEDKTKAEAEEKTKQEAEAKAKQEADEKAKKEAEDKANKEPAAAAETEEDELERIIREMEEEDRRREAAEEEHRKKAEAAKAAAKEEEEKNRKAAAAENDRKLREAEREMERLEEEKERKAKENAASGASVQDLLSQARSGKEVDSVTEKMAGVSLDSSKPSTPTSATGTKTPSEKQQRKPAALNLSLNTKPVEPPQPSAALQSLKTSRFLTIKEASDPNLYAGTALASPNPAVNAAVGKKGQSFKYDAAFLLQFQNVFTEQPSMEFQTQVKSLIGDADGNRSASRTPSSRQGSSRAPSGFPGQIGSFQNPRSMPPGGPPGDRMGMPGGALPRSGMGALQFSQGPGRSFPGSPLIGGRQPSSGGRHEGSRQGSRAGRSGSHRPGRDAQKEAQAAKTMPLTAGMELKPITTSSTGWKPTSIGNRGQTSASGHLEPEMVQRKVKAALNKMTPENFSRISDQILAIANQSKNENDGRTLRQVIQLTFEKATDESHFSSTYAKFCKHMLDQMSPEIKDDAIKDKHGNVVSGGNLFRKYLLNRCQEEFEKGWSVKESDSNDKKAPGAELLTDEYYEAAAVKRRGLGLVRFIGELFKLGMLTERIIHGCVRHLVDYKEEPKEAEIESLSYLLRTVGAALDSSEKGRPMMDAYFQRIQSIIELPDLENRLKFMLMDVRDLREGGWKSSQADKGPKTLEEVRAEAEQVAAQKAAEAARSQGRGGGPRPPVGRGDARSFSANFNQANNTVGMDDLRRLKSGSRGTPGGMTLGPNSMLASRSNSGRRPGGPGGSLGRSGDNSGATSRTGTPPTRESSNAFGLLATMDSENPASPPTKAAQPAATNPNPDAGAAGAEKKNNA